jgi:hypothetical protein
MNFDACPPWAMTPPLEISRDFDTSRWQLRIELYTDFLCARKRLDRPLLARFSRPDFPPDVLWSDMNAVKFQSLISRRWLATCDARRPGQTNRD